MTLPKMVNDKKLKNIQWHLQEQRRRLQEAEEQYKAGLQRVLQEQKEQRAQAWAARTRAAEKDEVKLVNREILKREQR